MKVIARDDGSIVIDMEGTLLISSHPVGESEGDASRVTIQNGYFLGLAGGKLQALKEAAKWIMRQPFNGEGNAR